MNTYNKIKRFSKIIFWAGMGLAIAIEALMERKRQSQYNNTLQDYINEQDVEQHTIDEGIEAVPPMINTMHGNKEDMAAPSTVLKPASQVFNFNTLSNLQSGNSTYLGYGSATWTPKDK